MGVGEYFISKFRTHQVDNSCIEFSHLYAGLNLAEAFFLL